MENNPYTSPAANLFGSSAATSAVGVSEAAISQLRRTKPWVRFLSVMAWIGMVLLLLSGAGILLGSILAGDAFAKASPGVNKYMMSGIGALYLILGFVYLYPAIKLWKYGTMIAKLVASQSTEHLESALDQQRSIWKFLGIMTILMIVAYALFFGGMMFYTISRAAGGSFPAS